MKGVFLIVWAIFIGYYHVYAGPVASPSPTPPPDPRIVAQRLSDRSFVAAAQTCGYVSADPSMNTFLCYVVFELILLRSTLYLSGRYMCL